MVHFFEFISALYVAMSRIEPFFGMPMLGMHRKKIHFWYPTVYSTQPALRCPDLTCASLWLRFAHCLAQWIPWESH